MNKYNNILVVSSKDLKPMSMEDRRRSDLIICYSNDDPRIFSIVKDKYNIKRDHSDEEIFDHYINPKLRNSKLNLL